VRLLAALLAALPLVAATACDDDVKDSERLSIREIRVRSVAGALDSVPLPLQSGSILTQEALSESIDRIRVALRSTGNRRIEVVFVTSCVTRLDSGGVDVEIRPWTLRVGAPVGLDERMQPKPRWPSNGQAPGAAGWTLRDPEFGLGYDRALDTSLRAGTAADRGPLRVEVAGERSMRSSSYDALGAVSWSQDRERGRVTLAAAFEALGQPLGPVDRRYRNALRTQAAYRWSGRGAWFRGAAVSGAYRFSGNRAVDVATTENAGEFRGAVDYRLAGGVGRTSVLADLGAPASADSYQRAALMSHWNAEAPVGGGQTLGLDIQFGWGAIRGQAPSYARFYAGSQQGRFLADDSLDAHLVRPAVWGPVVRALGVAESAAARSYTAINVNAALPVPRWSRFLIPRETDDDGVTLSQRIEGAGLRSSESALIAHYKVMEGLPEAEAQRRARADIATVKPAVIFLSRYAKLFAVRPLAMFDAVRLGEPGRTLIAAGGGMQFLLVVAKLDAGYIWLTNRRETDPRGNFVLRLSFQNLF
jgi:hypothetical protein